MITIYYLEIHFTSNDWQSINYNRTQIPPCNSSINRDWLPRMDLGLFDEYDEKRVTYNVIYTTDVSAL